MRRPAPFVDDCADRPPRIAAIDRAPRADVAELHDRLRAIRIVKREHRTLREQVGCALARGMIGIAFDLRRPAFVAFDQQARADAAVRHRGREKQRLAGNFFFGLADVRDDQFLRLHRARGDAGQRHRRAHQLQEVAAADRIEPLRGVARELAMQVVLELRRLGDFVEAAPHVRRPAAISIERARSP